MNRMSDDIMRQVHEEIRRRGIAPGSLDELNNIIEFVTARYNRSPVKEFEGLSREQMDILLRNPFSPGCVIKFRTGLSGDHAVKSPIVEMFILLSDAIRSEKGLKLTPSGRLTRKIIERIRELDSCRDIFPGPGFTGLLNEHDYLPSAYIHALSKLSGLIILKGKKLFLTEKGEVLTEDPAGLFRDLFKTFLTRFNNGYLDRYESMKIGTVGTLYTVFLLNRYGTRKKSASFYAERYLTAFPDLTLELARKSEGINEESATHSFIYRSFYKGLFLFGLVDVDVDCKSLLPGNETIRTTDLFNQAFRIDYANTEILIAVRPEGKA